MSLKMFVASHYLFLVAAYYNEGWSFRDTKLGTLNTVLM